MNEKILIHSQHYKLKTFTIIILVVGIIISICSLVSTMNDNYALYYEMYHRIDEKYMNMECDCSGEDYESVHSTVDSFMDCIGAEKINSGEVITSFIPLYLMIVLVAFVYLWLSQDQLTVTDKRVYGKAAFGRRVDLPIDSISAVGTSWLKGIDVGTSSGRIHFKLVKNQEEIHSVMSKLLMERQQVEKNNKAKETPAVVTSNADELKKFKELLDSGIITQEEFDAKKKQLLGL